MVAWPLALAKDIIVTIIFIGSQARNLNISPKTTLHNFCTADAADEVAFHNPADIEYECICTRKKTSNEK